MHPEGAFTTLYIFICKVVFLYDSSSDLVLWFASIKHNERTARTSVIELSVDHVYLPFLHVMTNVELETIRVQVLHVKV